MQPTEPSREHASFHVDDDVYLDYHAADSAPDDDYRGKDFCHELLQLRELSHQANHILATLRKHHSEISHYLTLLDRKVELLAQMVATLGMGEKIAPTHQVSLGPDGLIFEAAEALTLNSRLQLKLILFPSYQCLHLTARVVRCEARDAGGYLTELQFEATEEAQQDALIRHLLEKQSAALRRERSGN